MQQTPLSTARDSASPKPKCIVLFEHLHKSLLPAWWTEVPLGYKDAVDLVFTEGRFSSQRRLWEVRSRVKSRLSAGALTNKVELHERLSRASFRSIPTTLVVTKRAPPRLPDPAKVWIWRPEFGFSGRGTAVVCSQAEVDVLWENTTGRALLSEYIADPTLVNVGGGLYKFHIRMYAVLAVIPPGCGILPGRRCCLFREGEIFNAREEYKNSDYRNPRVHDTHLKCSERLSFPRDYPGGDQAAALVLQQISEMLANVFGLLAPHAEPYPESAAGFELLGIDLMVDGEGLVWLIEINDRVGFGEPTQNHTGRSRRLSEMLLPETVKFVYSGATSELVCLDTQF